MRGWFTTVLLNTVKKYEQIHGQNQAIYDCLGKQTLPGQLPEH
jgi:hypothetical protein